MKKASAILIVLSALLVAGMAAHGVLAADRAYVGAEKCKMCHNSPTKGAQYTKWAESAHSKAFQTLASEEAKKVAAARKIAEPQKAPECLKCHVAGAGAPAGLLTDKYKAEDGVSCEACHGPGGDYNKLSVMKDPALAKAAGLLMPAEADCKKCHNAESPTFKGFDWKTFYPKIAHEYPPAGAKPAAAPAK